MSCIIVGNGTSILDAERGEVIDSYDVVARFNQCGLKGFEKYTGTKTTIWFTVVPFSPFQYTALAPSEIRCHSWHARPEDCAMWKSYQSLPNATKVDWQQVLAEMREFGSKGYMWYSTGAIAAWTLSKEHGSVDLVGFDWWGREDHHYSDKVTRGPTHKPDKEKEFFDRLVADGRARFL